MNEFPVPKGFWDLPSCPQVIGRLLKLLPLPQDSLGDVLEIVRWDPALTVRILLAANGTKFGQTWPVVDLARARLLLDDFAVRILALQCTLPDSAADDDLSGPMYEVYWRKCHVQAVTAQILGAEYLESSEVDPFLAGLLIELDRLAAIQSRAEEARRVFERVIDTARTWPQAEQDIIGKQHPPPSRALFAGANLPASFLQAVKSLHSPPQEKPTAAPSLAGVLAVAVAMGDYLVLGERNSSLKEQWHARLVTCYTQWIGAHQDQHLSLEDLIDSVRDQLSEQNLTATPVFSAAELAQLANRELGRQAWLAAVALRQAQSRASEAEHALKQSERKIDSLERQALRDPLTGVYNRRFLLEALHKEVARCCRYGTPIGLLFVDVDRFKPLNDTLGHLVGDAVLRQVADVLGGVLRGADILARFGGEEFVILPNDPHEKGVLQLAERVRTAVEHMLVDAGQQQVTVTVSVGCTITVPTRGDLALAPRLLAAADAAMYEAKQLGRNRVVFRSLMDEAERDLMQRTVDCSFSQWLIQRKLLSPQAMEQALLDYTPEELPLGELAIDLGLLTGEQVAEILEKQDSHDQRFGKLALEKQWLTPMQLATLLARQRENPLQLARLLISKNLLPKAKALQEVQEYFMATQPPHHDPK